MATNEEDAVLLLAMLPALVPFPPDHINFFRTNINMIAALINMMPCPRSDLRFRHFAEDRNRFIGKDLFTSLSNNRYMFYQITGETPETLIDLEMITALPPDTENCISNRNKILLYLIWLRGYLTYSMLSNMFQISTTAVHTVIVSVCPIFLNAVMIFVSWPTNLEWKSLRGTWPRLYSAVGAIDGTSHEINRPGIEPQQPYYSGYRSYHAIHTQVVVDVHGVIRHIECGFLGHTNDAQQFSMMQQIGSDLNFPTSCFLLADKIYPNRYPLLTPYTAAQLRQRNGAQQRKCRKFNRYVGKHRISVEHAIAELKAYKATSSVWRHQRDMLPKVVETCGALVCRRKSLDIIL